MDTKAYLWIQYLKQVYVYGYTVIFMDTIS